MIVAAAANGVAVRSAPWIAYVLSGVVVLILPCGIIFLCWVVGRDERGGGDFDDGQGEGGGGGGGGDRTPPKGSPEPGADWWPECERQFAAYVGSHRDVRGNVTSA